MWEIVSADVLEWARSYDGPRFHALICDPPYELGFMGKRWDNTGVAFQPEAWAALAEHLHPGAFGMAFGGSRTWHRIACAIEDAGMVIHPTIFCWAFGSGFPKATRIDTQIDKVAGAKREVVGRKYEGLGCRRNGGNDYGQYDAPQELEGLSVTAPATPLAAAWEGHRYGLQALKPAVEPIIVFQKPYDGKPVECITETGAGALWIDGGRVGLQGAEQHTTPAKSGLGHNGIYGQSTVDEVPTNDELPRYNLSGRWPANFCLVHSPECRRVGTKRVKGATAVRHNSGGNNCHTDTPKPSMDDMSYADAGGLETVDDWECVPDCPVRLLGEQSGESKSVPHAGAQLSGNGTHEGWKRPAHAKEYPKWAPYADTGTAARFFHQSDWSYEIAEQIAAADPVRYQAKASRRERDAGLDEADVSYWSDGREKTADYPKQRAKTPRRNPHPTVKPIALIQYLATLLLPPAMYAPRRILVPFAGSGSEMIGAGLAGWEEIVGIEAEAEYCEIAEPRLRYWLMQPALI